MEKLTEQPIKKKIRNYITLNSVSKDEIRQEYNEIYDKLKEYEDRQEWISVNERLPKEREIGLSRWDDETLALIEVDNELVSDGVLVVVIDYEHEEKVFVATDCTINGQWANFGVCYKVTHWMPLPQPPQMKGAE